MTTMLTSIGEVFTWAIGKVADVFTVITNNTFLLLLFGIGMVGFIIHVAKMVKGALTKR